MKALLYIFLFVFSCGCGSKKVLKEKERTLNIERRNVVSTAESVLVSNFHISRMNNKIILTPIDSSKPIISTNLEGKTITIQNAKIEIESIEEKIDSSKTINSSSKRVDKTNLKNKSFNKNVDKEITGIRRYWYIVFFVALALLCVGYFYYKKIPLKLGINK